MGSPWLLATRSVGKLRELRTIFAEHGVDVVDLDQAGIAESAAEEDIECYDSFEENAAAKARYFASRAPGLTVAADDSGLEVIALGGEPGVRSKRWSGRVGLSGRSLDEANNATLAMRMRGQTDRRAKFVCVAALCRGSDVLVCRGEVAGRILDEPSGTDGFGYDPYFHSDELGVSLAAARESAKTNVSHRGRAFRALLDRVAGGA